MSRAIDLDAFLTEVRGRAFDWSTWNCCHLAAAWVQRTTGRNVMQGLPSTPDRRAAHRLIHHIGGTLGGVWTRWLGIEPVAPALARPGDVVLIAEGSARAAGICIGPRVAVLTPVGLAVTGMDAATHAWRLP